MNFLQLVNYCPLVSICKLYGHSYSLWVNNLSKLQVHGISEHGNHKTKHKDLHPSPALMVGRRKLRGELYDPTFIFQVQFGTQIGSVYSIWQLFFFDFYKGQKSGLLSFVIITFLRTFCCCFIAVCKEFCSIFVPVFQDVVVSWAFPDPSLEPFWKLSNLEDLLRAFEILL